jgi:hypothetical protein
MKPPTDDTTTFHYDAMQWLKVRRSLDRIGVDADTATVLYGKVPLSGKKVQCPLQVELERLAQKYCVNASMRIPTAREVIDATADDIKKIAVVRDLFVWESTWVPYAHHRRTAAGPRPRWLYAQHRRSLSRYRHTHALAFPRRRVIGGWIDAETNKRVYYIHCMSSEHFGHSV